ncbi:hypothetical protein PAXRUDRAFT_136159 [Paxillus rubicundulus Ve08.2h10]|uniref:Uncharacterized protein n=1 Tax=Paxillus rubicundulus Ve08.2h10 TaxID=930991 RepID=A0A0D0EBF0_9AGAM|nr:hypothetical protein PAXRUDRAFT_136159 [Paxillus rubicundulus Ve08.2h10]
MNEYVVHEITKVPAPIPDTGLPPPSDDTAAYYTAPLLPSSQTSPASKTTSTHLHTAPLSTFIPLPSLKTLNLTGVEGEVIHSPVIQPTLTPKPAQGAAAGVDQYTRPPVASSHRLSTTAIVALSVSGGLLVLVIAILVQLFKRPRRRRTPTPSLPILQDGTFQDDKFESEGSPVFGGKERLSPSLRSTKGNTGLWAWTQYHSGILKPAPAVTVTRASSQNQQSGTVDSSTHDIVGDDKAVSVQGHQYPFMGIGNVAHKNTSGAPLQPVQNAITRAVSRLSTVSMSLYPNSPGSYSQIAADVGLAIDGALDERSSPLIPKHKDKIAVSRNRASMIAPLSAKDPTALRRSQSFAYGGMEPTSSISENRVPSNGGRARIKSTYYTPGPYPRISTTPTSYLRQDRGGHIDGTHHNPGVQRLDSRRGRDLTTALGLVSPIPPSPQPTLYPDDSMSVIGEAKKVTVVGHSQKKPVPKRSSYYDQALESPPSDTAALGSLMMVDFAASKSTASLVNIRPSEAARTREVQGGAPNGYSLAPLGKTNMKKRVADKPPRVPSPPPMPSLAQMALQHANPEAYGDYHSPTYSIYGLYDGDRKSRGTSFGY